MSNDERDSGWKVVATWQFTVFVAIITTLAIVANWVTSKSFDLVQVLIVVLPALIVLVLSWCTFLYLRYSGELRINIYELQILHYIIKDLKLRKAIDERKWLIHSDEVQNNELSNSVTENWTLTPDFRYEILDFQKVVIENFRKNLIVQEYKTKYEYIYPNTEMARQFLDEFRKILVTKLIKILPSNMNADHLLELNKYVHLYPLKESIIPLNEGIHNPKGGESKMGLLMTPEDDFPYYIKLSPYQTNALIVKFRQLKKLSEEQYRGKEFLFLTKEIIDECLLS